MDSTLGKLQLPGPMKTTLNSLTARNGDRILWVIVLISIPLLSYFGRPMQHFIEAAWGHNAMGWIGSILGMLALLAAAFWVYRLPGFRYSVYALILIVIIGIAFTLVAHPIERAHFALFGLFGFLCFRLFGVFYSLLTCVLIGGADELFQWFLPDRVGDWHDVVINLVAGFTGCWAAWMGYSRPDDRITGDD